jgi:hypothetical protein
LLLLISRFLWMKSCGLMLRCGINSKQFFLGLGFEEIRVKVGQYLAKLSSAGHSETEELTYYGLAYLRILHEGPDPRYTGCWGCTALRGSFNRMLLREEQPELLLTPRVKQYGRSPTSSRSLLAFTSGATFGADADHGSILAQRWCAVLPRCIKCSTDGNWSYPVIRIYRAESWF